MPRARTKSRSTVRHGAAPNFKPSYSVRIYKGDYIDRQRQANTDKCVAYVEHHFNSSDSPNPNFAVVITGANASQTSRNWGRWYAAAVAREFELNVGGDRGIQVGGYSGRGDANLRYTDMPAILLEPLFASNPRHAEIIRSDAGQSQLALILCDSIQRFFPKGGRIGFSVGHKYKTSTPRDRGAAIVGGGWEADFAEAVLLKAKARLEQAYAPQEERVIRIVKGDQELWRHPVDADADLHWDPVRGVLRIP